MSDYASTSSRPTSPVGELPQVAKPTRPYRFTWDAAQRKSGPGSVSDTTEGRGDYFAGQGPYDVLSGGPATPQPGSYPPEWSSSVHGFHAISTVVNSPHKKSAPPKAHSALPSVPPADLPRVKRKDFDPYLRSVASEWERFERNAQEGREGVAQITSPDERPSSPAGKPTTPRTPRPPPGKPLPPLETVPEVYFEKHFNLGDPRTFNVVTEFSDQHEGFMLDDPESFTYAQPLIDKMCGYADTIEQHLVREISIRSTSFFAALSNLQDLQTESEQCLSRIQQLRGLLKEVDEKSAVKGLEVIRAEGRMRNLRKVRNAVGALGNVVEMIGVARGLVDAGQWGEALDVVDELDALWDIGLHHQGSRPIPAPSIPSRDSRRLPLPTVVESPVASVSPQISEPVVQVTNNRIPAPSIPISSLLAFGALPSNLRTLILQIASSLTSEIVSVLKNDLVDRIDHSHLAPSSSSGMNGHGDKKADEGMQLSLKDKLRPLLRSLARTGSIREAVTSWREVVLTEVVGILKRHIPLFSLDAEDSSEDIQSAKDIASMEQSAFLELARAMYDRFLSCVEGIQLQNTIIIEVLDSIHQPKGLDVSALREELGDVLSSAGELANARAAKVISLRTEQHTSLDLKEFWIFFNVSWDFVVKTEIICRRMIVGLRGVVVSQSKTFLQAFHQSRLSQSAKLVEDELWNPMEVNPPVQQVVNLLVEASIQDPVELSFNPPPPMSPVSTLSPTPASPNPSTLNGNPIQPSSPVPSPLFPSYDPKHLQTRRSPDPSRRRSSGIGPSKHLKIEDRNFFAVSATLEVLVLLSDYLRVIVNLPTLVTETMSRVIELLKAFNSRTCQVVLGAGAMRSAGLKNITAKHLALASQSLSIMISLIPYVRETFRRHLTQQQAVMLIEFDKLKRDYQEHQNEIHAKLIAIMGDRLSAHIKTLQVVNWDVPKPGGGANEYMELLAKETVTLHKVLSRYLSVSVVEFVMSQVFAAINHRLSEEFAAIDLPTIEAKERPFVILYPLSRLLADARFLHEKLSGLKNVRAPTAMLEIVVQEKRVGPQTQQPLSPQPQPQRMDTNPIPSPPPSTTSRFAHMFSRAAPPRSATLLPTPRATTPVPTDFEKPLPIASPSPEPTSMLSDHGPFPTPPRTASSSRPQSPAMMNGHVSPLSPQNQESQTEPAASPALPDVVGSSHANTPVGDPQDVNAPPAPPAKADKVVEDVLLSEPEQPANNGTTNADENRTNGSMVES
ncbi:Vps54-like protein-domain-containing protein [Cytidiella melzeri]|nr:Vps54-like protein-domain-containing protein [Cytidiella melzeri]